MIFTWKDRLFITVLTAVFILSGNVVQAARPANSAIDTGMDINAAVTPPRYGDIPVNAMTAMLIPPSSPEMSGMETDPPMPAIPSKLLVFFEVAKTDLRPDAKLIVRKAAAEVQRHATDVTVIQVAETSGLTNGNRQLSKQRADAVKGELVRLGVPEDEIVVSAKAAPAASRGRVEIVYR